MDRKWLIQVLRNRLEKVQLVTKLGSPLRKLGRLVYQDQWRIGVVRARAAGDLAVEVIAGLDKSVSVALQTSSVTTLAALDIRLNLATVPDRAGADAVGKAVGLVTLSAVEVASPVRRLVSLQLNGLVVRHL